MKIQLVSDTHCANIVINKEADLVVHAGDIGNGNQLYVDLFAKTCRESGKDFIFVLGNHDYYGSSIKDTINKYKDLYPDNFLYGQNTIEKQGTTFVGGTLFSNFRANKILYSDPVQFDKNKQNAEQFVNDFFHINKYNSFSKIVADDYVTMFNKEYNYINKYRDTDAIVITHFPPHLCCLDPYWGSHPTASCLNPFFINDLDVKGFKYWLSGHTHTFVNEVVDGCNIVINPLGYRNEFNSNGFVQGLILEV